MPRISKRPLSKEKLEEISNQFAQLIASLNVSFQIKQFLDSFLTKEEKLMLSKRLMMYIMLKNDYSTNDIKTTLNLSNETIRSHKIFFEQKDEVFQKIISKMNKKRNTAIFLKALEKKTEKLDHFLKAKTNIKSRGKLIP